MIIDGSVRSAPPMKSRLVAIGVTQGDAFFLERRDGFTALIDGGRSASGFPAEFQRATQRDSVDVIVCTHNDADHANGIIGFLQSGLRCKEVWLPASWTDRLRDLFRPEQFTRELVDNVMDLGEPEASNIRETDTLLERLADGYQMRDQARNQRETLDAESLVEGTLEESSDDQIGLSHYPLFCWHPDWPFFWRKFWVHDPRFRLFVEAVAAGDRIRQITRLAFHRGCRIRWFEFSSEAEGGFPATLVPVNAREMQKVSVNNSTALMYLALTITNRQSLVFCAPRERTAPAILFTADSDLSFPNVVPWSEGMLVSAPHHGSEANAAAYKRFRSEMPIPTSTVWLRSDGRFRSRPGSSFLGLRVSNVPVFCTLCRRASQPKQDLLFAMSLRRWRPVNTRACLCK